MKNLFATAASVFVLGFAMPAMAQSNNSTVNQLGSAQTATVDQIGTAANNDSVVWQGLNIGGSSYNDADIDQTGTVNIENFSKLFQDGYYNTGKVDQGGNGNGGDYNNSYAVQNGTLNELKVFQGDLATNNNSFIDQNGNNNKSTVKQGGGEGGNLVNLSTIDQDGYDNHATVEQGGANTVANTSTVIQQSFGYPGNTATVNQH
jgi:hypothetical protein